MCRLKKNRRFNGYAVRAYRRHPDWTACGWLTGGLKVLVVSYGAKDLRHESPATAGGGGAAVVSCTGPHRGGHPRLQRSTRVDGLSSALGAGAAASSDLLFGGILWAGAGTA
jgi:hypothetical protein